MLDPAQNPEASALPDKVQEDEPKFQSLSKQVQFQKSGFRV